MQLAPIAAALDERARGTTKTGLDHIVALWRHEAADATMRFLAAMTPLSRHQPDMRLATQAPCQSAASWSALTGRALPFP